MSTNNQRLLTETELELMGILWSLGEGSVTQVMEKLPKGRNLAYTSVSTILRILEQKEVLKSRKEGRGHIYIPLLKKVEYEKRTLKHVVDNVFEGTPISLIKRLIGSTTLKENELDEIKKLIEEAKNK